jgi:hypothetical protein
VLDQLLACVSPFLGSFLCLPGWGGGGGGGYVRLSMSGVGTYETDPSESYLSSCAVTRKEKRGGNEGMA